LDEARFDPPMLTCPCHGHEYDLGRGGACAGSPGLRLESLASKVEDDKLKVALS
jgi:nitrite reductase/ring-hydroxylating ferredoxin subunit